MADVIDHSDPQRHVSVWPALRRGLALRCPQCGQGRIFRRYLKVHPTCASCGLELQSFRSDDAPPYFTMLIVGHIIVPGMLLLEQLHHPPSWVHAALWLPLTLALTLGLLPRIKGAVIGFQWAHRIRG
jgi:uncharacterized protein (DUF983 family)